MGSTRYSSPRRTNRLPKLAVKVCPEDRRRPPCGGGAGGNGTGKDRSASAGPPSHSCPQSLVFPSSYLWVSRQGGTQRKHCGHQAHFTAQVESHLKMRTTERSHSHSREVSPQTVPAHQPRAGLPRQEARPELTRGFCSFPSCPSPHRRQVWCNVKSRWTKAGHRPGT